MDPLRIPPHNLQSEQSVIGGLLISPGRLDDVLMLLSADDFYLATHQTIFVVILALSEESAPIDVVTVSERLERDELLDDAGGMPYVISLARETPSAANILGYAKAVADHAKARKLITIGAEITNLGFEGGPIDDRLDRAQAATMALDKAQDSGLTPMRECLKDAVEALEERFNSGSGISGLRTGFSEIDKLTSGLINGELILLPARPSQGKTTLALNIACNVGLAGGAVAVFSMEMQTRQLVDRQYAAIGNVLYDHVRNGQLTDDEWPRLTEAVSKLAETKISIDETPALSVYQVRARARSMHRKTPLSLVIIDYLQLMQGAGEENRNLEVSAISRGLKSLAKELNVPVIALSQLNRALEHRPDRRPILSDLRDSGALEADADLVMFVYRDILYNDEADKREAEIIIAKQRNGPIGTVKLTFEGEYVRFRDYSPPVGYAQSNDWRDHEPNW